MRGAEGVEERGTERAEERGAKCAERVRSGEGVFSSPFGVWFGEGHSPSTRSFYKIHVEFTHFAAFCEDYGSLRLTKFTKLNKLYLFKMSSSQNVINACDHHLHARIWSA